MLDFIGKAKAQVGSIPDISPLRPGNVNLTQLILNIINFIIFLAGALALVYLIYGGILYITAGGDEAKATKGKTAIINAIIGIAIVLLALFIITLVRNSITGTILPGQVS